MKHLTHSLRLLLVGACLGNIAGCDRLEETPETVSLPALEAPPSASKPVPTCEDLTLTLTEMATAPAEKAPAAFAQVEAAYYTCQVQARQLYPLIIPHLSGESLVKAQLHLGWLLLSPELEAEPGLKNHRALEHLQQGMQLAETLQLPCLWLQGRTHEAHYYQYRSQLSESRKALDAAFLRLESCSNNPIKARVWARLAEQSRQENQPVAQYHAIRQALRLSDTDPRGALYFEIDLAELRHDLGDIADEGDGYRRLITRAEALDPTQVTPLYLKLANLYRDLGRLNDSTQVLEEVLDEITRRIDADPSQKSKLPVVHVLLAWGALETSPLTPAQITMARTHLEMVSPETFTGGVARLSHLHQYVLGRLQLAERQPLQAAATFKSIVADARAEAEPRWRARLGLAQALNSLDKPLEARATLWEAISALEQQHDALLEHPDTESAFWSMAYLSQREDLYLHWLDALVAAWRQTGARAQTSPSKFSSVSRAWDPARSFVQGPVTGDDLLAAVEKISSQQLSAALFRDRDGVEGASPRASQTWRRQQERGWQSGATLRALLPPTLPVLIYQPLEREILLLEVRASGVQVHLLPLDRKALRIQVQALEEHMTAQRAESPIELETLGKLLLDPIKDRLPGPDAELGLVLPPELETVPMSGLRIQGKYLVERCAPFELPNLRAIKTLPERVLPEGPWQAVGVAHGENLHYAQREVALLQKPGLNALLLTGPLATLDRVSRALPERDLLHFSMHSTPPSNTSITSNNQVTTSPGRIELENGFLTAARIQGMTLRAKLAVMNGCQTRLGRLGQRLEHGYGALHRAMLLAGAEAVIASRWKIGDAASFALMEHFYAQSLARGRAKALALAQRAMLASVTQLAAGATRDDWTYASTATVASIPHASPWSWAALTLVGRWD